VVIDISSLDPVLRQQRSSLGLIGLAGCGEELQVAAANGPPARPLRTGQTGCYDASGNTTDPIPCAGTGQDGATQTGVVRRYTDNQGSASGSFSHDVVVRHEEPSTAWRGVL
jgi:hypothetical protein